MTDTLSRTSTDAPAERSSYTFRPLLMRIHFYAGILVGPFILTAAITGLLYAFAPQPEELVYHDQLYTDVRGESLPLSQQVAQARTVEPTATLSSVRPAPEPGRTTQVLFTKPELGETTPVVFVDPVSGEVKGALTSAHEGQLPLASWLDELHGNLHLGPTGEIYSELAASWLWVIVLAGLLMWWTRRRKGPRWRPTRSGAARRRTLSWHAALGTWVSIGLLMLSATGLTWSRFAGENVGAVKERFAWQTPDLAASWKKDKGPAGHQGHAGHEGHEGHDMGGMSGTHHRMPSDAVGVGPDGAARAAAGLGVTAPIQVMPPRDARGTYVVKGADDSWRSRKDAVAVDAKTGQVTKVVRFADWPFMAKMSSWGINLHMGRLFGPVNQLALATLAVSAIVLVAFGYRMWWLRRPTRGHRLRFGRPFARGTWRRAPRPAVVALLVAAAGIGCFLPVLGVSLLAFLVVDVVVGLVTGRRLPPRAPDRPADDRVLVG